MAFDLGDSVPLAVDVTDANGALVNATAITLTITLPDGTTTSPSVTNPPASTGQYRVTYVSVQEGRHTVRWVTTNPSTAYQDVFDVRAAASPALLSLADVKAHLNIPATNTSSDDELRGFIESATAVVEEKIGPVVRRTRTAEVVGGGCRIRLPHTQVLSITSLTLIRDGSSPVNVNDLSVNGPRGVVTRKDDGRLPVGRLLATYVVGRIVVDANWIEAAKIIVKHLWETQLGNLPSIQGDSPGYVVTGSGHLVPYRAEALLEPDYVAFGYA